MKLFYFIMGTDFQKIKYEIRMEHNFRTNSLRSDSDWLNLKLAGFQNQKSCHDHMILSITVTLFEEL